MLARESLPITVREYVSSICEHLDTAREVARKHLAIAQIKMKSHYDQGSVQRSFQPGNKVLVLLPDPGSVPGAKFSGPYAIREKLSDTDYTIYTPDRRRKIRVCHINMLKQFVEHGEKPVPSPVLPTVAVVVDAASEAAKDGPAVKSIHSPAKRLKNSAILKNLQCFLAHLSKEQSEQIISFIQSYPSLFSDVPGRTSVIQHDIDVGEAPPVKQHSYRVNPRKLDIMRTEVEYMLKHGIAVSSQSPWSSPCLLVPESNGSYRFCTDYRKVNSLTKPDSFPLPRMEDCIDRVGSANYVTKIDLLKGYWQVPLTPRAKEISAFVTPEHFLQYEVLAFGMRNAPATFQQLMQLVLMEVPNCAVYLDDIVVYSKT